ncbi:MAG: DciA family protein [Alphaproteobacteria bacterium]|nr:DciA family protein [Alphaproteobacteria bacterium]
MPGDRDQDKTGVRTKRGGGPKPLATTVGGLAKRTIGKRGFAEAGLITDWEKIVGQELAASCWPDRLAFPPGKRDGGSLRIRVAGGFALELQHMEPRLLERINGHFGYRAVERITIIHAPPDKKMSAHRRRPKNKTVRPPDPQATAAIEDALSSVDDPDIRAVLARLGHAVISDSQGDGEE